MALALTFLQRFCRASLPLTSINKQISSTEPTKTKEICFAKLERSPPIEAHTLEHAYVMDRDIKKINLGINSYRTTESKPCVFRVVRKAEIGVACDDYLNHEYYPTFGNPEFTQAAMELTLGAKSPAVQQKRAFAIQTLSSTGALRLAADFLHQQIGCDVCLYADSTAERYDALFRAAGFNECKPYKYFDTEKGKLSIHGIIADLLAAPEGSVAILQPSAHNPTGVDPNEEEWKLIAHVMKCKKMLPLFDMRYQGLASGNPEQDAWPVHFFVDNGLDVMCAQSFSKNFCLYNERIGCLTVVLEESSGLEAAKTHFDALIRKSYRSPPAFGSRIVAKVLLDASLRREWLETLKEMTLRMKNARLSFTAKLNELKVPGNWECFNTQLGMYSCLRLADFQMDKLIKQKHIYLPKSGRINVCCLTEQNIDYIAKALKDVLSTDKLDAVIQRELFKKVCSKTN